MQVSEVGICSASVFSCWLFLLQWITSLEMGGHISATPLHPLGISLEQKLVQYGIESQLLGMQQ